MLQVHQDEAVRRIVEGAVSANLGGWEGLYEDDLSTVARSNVIVLSDDEIELLRDEVAVAITCAKQYDPNKKLETWESIGRKLGSGPTP